jgi:ferredoxin
MKPKISAGKCISCYLCISECPVESITVSDSTGKAYIDPKRCSECGHCIKICPVKAIKGE